MYGSDEVIEHPIIVKEKYEKDFGDGFYCTIIEKQAVRVATRYNRPGVLNTYEFNNASGMNIKRFNGMTDDWLEFIIACRDGKKHNYDIVEGPVIGDMLYNHFNDYIANKITREEFWELAKFIRPTYEISFNTNKALSRLEFKRWSKV